LFLFVYIFGLIFIYITTQKTVISTRFQSSKKNMLGFINNNIFKYSGKIIFDRVFFANSMNLIYLFTIVDINFR